MDGKERERERDGELKKLTITLKLFCLIEIRENKIK